MTRPPIQVQYILGHKFSWRARAERSPTTVKGLYQVEMIGKLLPKEWRRFVFFAGPTPQAIIDKSRLLVQRFCELQGSPAADTMQALRDDGAYELVWFRDPFQKGTASLRSHWKGTEAPIIRGGPPRLSITSIINSDHTSMQSEPQNLMMLATLASLSHTTVDKTADKSFHVLSAQSNQPQFPPTASECDMQIDDTTTKMTEQASASPKHSNQQACIPAAAGDDHRDTDTGVVHDKEYNLLPEKLNQNPKQASEPSHENNINLHQRAMDHYSEPATNNHPNQTSNPIADSISAIINNPNPTADSGSASPQRQSASWPSPQSKGYKIGTPPNGPGVYVIQLDNGKYYVGQAVNVRKRVEEHRSKQYSAAFVSANFKKGNNIVYLEPQTYFPNDLNHWEKQETLLAMLKFKFENVRGGPFCQIQLKDKHLYHIKGELVHQMTVCHKCGRKGHMGQYCKETSKMPWIADLDRLLGECIQPTLWESAAAYA